MKTIRVLLAILTSGLAAMAQPAAAPASPEAASPPIESVIVTAPNLRDEKVLDNFILGHTVRSSYLGKVGRWKAGICPIVTGLPEAHSKFVAERVRQVANQVGAPVAAAGCKSNIDIVFTLNPQVLMDQVKAYTESYRIYKLRFDAGVLTSVDFIIAKNNLDSSTVNLISAKYDYFIDSKILDYYQGKLSF